MMQRSSLHTEPVFLKESNIVHFAVVRRQSIRTKFILTFED